MITERICQFTQEGEENQVSVVSRSAEEVLIAKNMEVRFRLSIRAELDVQLRVWVMDSQEVPIICIQEITRRVSGDGWFTIPIHKLNITNDSASFFSAGTYNLTAEVISCTGKNSKFFPGDEPFKQKIILTPEEALKWDLVFTREIIGGYCSTTIKHCQSIREDYPLPKKGEKVPEGLMEQLRRKSVVVDVEEVKTAGEFVEKVKAEERQRQAELWNKISASSSGALSEETPKDEEDLWGDDEPRRFYEIRPAYLIAFITTVVIGSACYFLFYAQ